jgi:hypothetical protein
MTDWFDGLTGLTAREAEARAADRLRRGRGFVVEWWGIVDAEPGDYDLATSMELGDRVMGDAARENAPDPEDRRDWLVTKALAASPALFVDLLAVGRR